ncbi:MAG TPA: hypothetical protein VMW72_13380 [Sedimentisphaerales bacterium]|nr:hypothetical protein [Sedimentisphaerales bacterium]
MWALRNKINNLIGPQQNIFEGQNRLGFSSHHQHTQTSQYKAIFDNATGEIYTIPRLLSQVTKPTPTLPIVNFLFYFGLFLADTINIGDKGLENHQRRDVNSAFLGGCLYKRQVVG